MTTPDERRMVERALVIAQDALEAGWPRDLIEEVLAVTMAETTAGLFMEGDLDKVGEDTDDGRTWGMSYGPMHVRSIQEETGTGLARDIERLRDPIGSMSAALEIYNEANGWSPWSSTKSIKGNPPRYLEYKPYAQQVDYILGLMESGQRASAPPVNMGPRPAPRSTTAVNNTSGR